MTPVISTEKAQNEHTAKVTNHILNKRVRMLDGQWQGTYVASDGNVYFAGGSHSAGVGAPFFRYDPKTREVKTLCQDITLICNEDPNKTPTQGKVHSEIIEHKGWIYFGTHLSDYSKKGRDTYTGGHLVGYEMATGKFRDYGIIHPNQTNYSGIGLDSRRGKIYFYTTPFSRTSEGDPHLYRIDIKSGEKKDLGVVHPRPDKTKTGWAAQHLFVDGRGDCWLTLHGGQGLFVARRKAGKIEQYNDAMPEGASEWYHAYSLSKYRALALMDKGAWIFDTKKFDGTPKCYSLLKEITTPGFFFSALAVDGDRFYWTDRECRPKEKGGRYDLHLWSASLKDPSDTINHGLIVDREGRTPWFIGAIVSDGKGRVYMTGRWYALESEVNRLAVNRHGMQVVVAFSEVDVSKEIAK